MKLLFFRLAFCQALLSFAGAAPAQAQAFSRDMSFWLNANFNTPGSGREIQGVIEHPDGKLTVYGHFTTGQIRIGLATFSGNGQPLVTFQTPTAPEIAVNYLTAMPYGYFAVGHFNLFYKFDHSGQPLDPGLANTMTYEVLGIYGGNPIFLPDGKYLIGCGECDYPRINPNRTLGLVRMLPSGHVDTTFAHNIYPDAPMYLAPYGPDKIFVAGTFPYYDTTPVQGMCRIDLDGNLDTTFHSIFTQGMPWITYVQPDGKILIAGHNLYINNNPQPVYSIRIHPDGSLDTTFNNYTNFFAGAVCPTSDGGYLLGGYDRQGPLAFVQRLVKTDANGYPQPGYFTGTGFDSAPFPSLGIPPYITSITRGSNDQYYVTGYFNGYNGQVVQPIIRLNGPLTVPNATEEEQERPQLQVYPNPANDQVFIGSTRPAHTGMVTVIDVLGRPVLAQPFSSQGQSLSLSQVPAGLYLVSVTDDKGPTWQQKLVVQK